MDRQVKEDVIKTRYRELYAKADDAKRKQLNRAKMILLDYKLR